jgi:hypothetical protein
VARKTPAPSTNGNGKPAPGTDDARRRKAARSVVRKHGPSDAPPGPGKDSAARADDTARFVLERIDARVVPPARAVRPEDAASHAATAELERLAAAALAAEEEYVYLFYDIPDKGPDGKTIPNPSPLLRWYGFRMNLSCWCLPRKGVDGDDITELLAYWDALGCIWFHVAPQPKEQNATHRRIARLKLEEEMRKAHTSLIRRMANADEAYAEAEAYLKSSDVVGDLTARQYEEAVLRRDGDVRTILTEVAESMRAAAAAAEAFDATEQIAPLKDALLHALRAEAEAYNAVAITRPIRDRKLVKVP